MARAAYLALPALLALLAAEPVLAAGDAEKGNAVFKACKTCHSLEAGKHKLGPSLAGVIGRTAGTAEGYKYSKAMKAYGESGVVWSEESLDVYLEAPRKVVKSTKMAFAGLKKPQQRADLIAYLQSVQ